MQELFKEIPGYEDKYWVSNTGVIKNKKHVLKQSISHGYNTVSLCKNGIPKKFLVHRLVAMAFIPNPDNLPIINHKDGNRLSNIIDNLEWCTQLYNVHHAFETGLIKRTPLTLSQKQYIAEKTKDAMRRPEVKEKLSHSRPNSVGKKRSEETKANMRSAWIKRKQRKEDA